MSKDGIPSMPSKFIDARQSCKTRSDTGAREIYKRTGSFTVLQQAMVHASLAVSLGSSGLNLARTNVAEQNSLYASTESQAKYWTSTPFNGNSESYLHRWYISPTNWLNQNWTLGESAREGLPIRCIKD